MGVMPLLEVAAPLARTWEERVARWWTMVAALRWGAVAGVGALLPEEELAR